MEARMGRNQMGLQDMQPKDAGVPILLFLLYRWRQENKVIFVKKQNGRGWLENEESMTLRARREGDRRLGH